MLLPWASSMATGGTVSGVLNAQYVVVNQGIVTVVQPIELFTSGIKIIFP